MDLLLIAALVLAIGVSLGLSGYGGFLVPALLVAVLHLATRDAVATGLLSFVLPGVLGAWLYWRQENRPSWYLTLLLCLGTVPGVLVGRLVSVSVADVTLQVLLGAVVIASGLFLLLRRRPPAGPPPPGGPRRLPARLVPAVLGAGFLGGLAAVVAGVGGPLVTVPILMSFGLDLAPLVGAALLNSVVVSLLGAASLLGAVHVDPLVLAVVTLAQLAGVPVGVWLQRRVRPARLVPVIAVVSAVTGVGLVWAALGTPEPPSSSGGAGRPVLVRSGRVDQSLPLPAQAGHLQLHHVAGAQVGEAPGQGDPLRGAGADHVAGAQHQVPAQVPDQVRHVEDHVGGAGVLPGFAVDPGAQPQRLRVGHLAGRYQPRPEREERLAALALGPLAAGLFDLEGALGHVVGDRVPGDAGRRVGGVFQVAGGASDDDGQFHLPVGLRRAPGDVHVVVRTDHGVRCLEEDDRHLRWRGAGLGGVRGVVHPDAHDLAGRGERRADARVPVGQDGQPAGGEGVGGPGRAVAGQERAVDVVGEPGQVEQGPVVVADRRSFPPGRAQSQ